MKRKTKMVFTLTALITLQALIIPIYAGGNNNPNKILGSPEFVLNILGKKDSWNPNGDFNNPERHTIFVPENGDTRIWITQAPRKSLEDFAVLDGNGFDEDGAALQLGDGYFAVYVVALGKPGGAGSTLGGLVTDSDGNDLFYLGKVDAKELKPHGKQPVWEEYTNLFYITFDEIVEYFIGLGYMYDDAVSNATAVIAFFENLEGADFIPDFDGDPLTYDPAVWIFDFFDYLVEVLAVDDGQYAWELKNKGIKHLQVRFYFVKSRYWEYFPEIM
jgi:hypothetical protein